jgi:hypothetical protein
MSNTSESSRAFYRSEEMGADGDTLLKSLIDEIQTLRGIVNPLKLEVKSLQDKLNEKTVDKEKLSIAEIYDTEDYRDQKYNVAAMTIILHKKNAQEWQQADLENSPIVFKRIHDEAHYLSFGKAKERILNKDGSYSISYLMVLR